MKEGLVISAFWVGLIVSVLTELTQIDNIIVRNK